MSDNLFRSRVLFIVIIVVALLMAVNIVFVWYNTDGNYQRTLMVSQLNQIIIFVICILALGYTAFYKARNYTDSEIGKSPQVTANKMSFHQKQEMAGTVSKQIEDMVTDSEEILSQREAILIQNKQLFEAQKTIELLQDEIRLLNQQLKTDVNTRTQELREANKHLLEQNNQLEQFAFIAAHNLRAPLTRILGLANLMKISQSEDDRDVAIEKMVSSTVDLDHVISDLNAILNIKRHSENLVEVKLENVLDRVKRTLEREIEVTHAVITADFEEANRVFAVAPYVESILYNLISNAIKYRDPARIPFIMIKTVLSEEFIHLSISDNGLGIDLSKHKHNLFSLYKRFHLHMEGKGLGLYLVKTQIESMGGTVEVESTPNEGTSFHVNFRRYLI